MSTFREPTGELPEWVERYDDERYMLSENDGESVDTVCLTVEKAEALLEVLLDICPNAKALAHNFLLERQKAEYMKGGGS